MKFHLISNCTVSFYGSKTFILRSNYSVYITKSGDKRVLSSEEYYPTANGVLACSTKLHKENIMDKVEEIAIYIGSSLSISGSTATILTYLCFKQLRNTPGMNLASLSLSILLSDTIIMYMWHVNNEMLGCKVLAAILHWFLLSSHLWCTVIVIDMFRTFKSNLPNQSNGRFKYYSSVIWTLSLAIACSALLLDGYDTVDGMEKKICWLVKLRLRWSMYIGPVILCLITTTSLFILSLRSIYLTRQETVSASQSSSQQSNRISIFWLAVRIGLLLGLIEVLGLIQVLKKGSTIALFNSIVQLLYSASRSLRGFFIFISFTCRKNVLKLYKESFSYIKSKYSVQMLPEASSSTNTIELSLNAR